MGTTRGNLWKIDLFTLRRGPITIEKSLWMEHAYLNKEGFRKEGIVNSAVRRIRRHWVVVAVGVNNKVYILKSEKWDEIRRYELLGKKNMPQW